MGDILIVDDERDIRELISDILKDEGFTTRLAGLSSFRPGFFPSRRPAGLRFLLGIGEGGQTDEDAQRQQRQGAVSNHGVTPYQPGGIQRKGTVL